MTNRREFLHRATVVGGAMMLDRYARDTSIPLVERAEKPLDILILGGTGLTGPFQVKYALERGHKVTVFNRGRRNDRLPNGVTELIGDRNLHQLDALRGKDWDVVIDNPTSLPFWVRDAAQVLKGHTKQYVFISTISVYETAGQTAINEASPLMEYKGGDPLAVTPEQFSKSIELYGPMKTASEREAMKQFGDRTTIIRPTLIVGPGDTSFRFTYWPYRIEKGGEVLAPGDGHDVVQIVDARDLAEWTIRVVENGTTGVFNAAGPRAALTMAEQLYGIRAAFDGNRDISFTWVPADFLAQQKVSMWSDMPTWVPRTDGDYAATHVSNTKAVAAGLTFRALATSVVDSLAWFNAQPEPARTQMLKSAGLTAEREKATLAAWHASRKA
ncbi:MAG TPA: NAD-dependent epimerase/dehydratase family protein [Gemmatimonadaceae bacterium]